MALFSFLCIGFMQVVMILNKAISPALHGEIARSFGSLPDFERALDRRATAHLVATDDARLRLAYEGETLVGTVLKRNDEALDYTVLSERFALFLTNRPRWPHP